MKLALLSFKNRPNLRSRRSNKNERLILEAAKRLGHTIKLIRVEKCQLYCGRNGMQVYYNNKPFPKFDAIIPRVSIILDIELGGAMIKHLEQCGHTVINSYQSVISAKNKLRTKQILIENNIPVPKTMVVRRFEFLDDAIKKIGGLPVVLKLPHGSLGVGVAIVESKRSLHSALDIFWKSRDHNYMLIQEYIKEAEGKDIRAYVINGKIVASMERSAKEGDFRSNMSIGGSGQPVKLTKKEEDMALKAAKAMNLEIAGVDLLRSKNGPLVMEVNCNPGLIGITEVTGVDVAGEIIRYVEQLVSKKKKA